MIQDLLGPADTDQFYQVYTSSYITERDIALIAQWGLNFVRVPFHYRLVYDPETQMFLEPGFDLLKTLMGWCKKYGIYVILDMHCAPGGLSRVRKVRTEQARNRPGGSACTSNPGAKQGGVPSDVLYAADIVPFRPEVRRHRHAAAGGLAALEERFGGLGAAGSCGDCPPGRHARTISAQSTFAGLDQVNVRVPRSLAGRGEVPIVLTAGGRQTNAVTVRIR